MRTTIALGSATLAALTLLAAPSRADSEFYRTPSGEVKYRWFNPNTARPHLFYYRGYAYPYYSGLSYRERTGELRPQDAPTRERVHADR
jgi:hypothetical protein